MRHMEEAMNTINDERRSRRKKLTLAGVLLFTAGLMVLGFGVWAQEPAAAVVEVATHATLGSILVGPEGMTLYTFAKDEVDALACTGGCAVNFPPLLLDGELIAPEGLPGELGTITRGPDDEARLDSQVLQVTYNGQPLYYWSRDEVPGDVSGNGIADAWSVVRP